MIRYNNIYEKIYNIDNLYLANIQAKKGKSRNKEVISFNKDLDFNIQKLHCELLSNTYNTSEYFHFTIKDPKERNISKLPYRDRVIQHSLLAQTTTIFLNTFISQTYSCIKRRGIHKALNVLKSYLKDENNTQYCLKLDIAKFYPNVDNETLKKLLRRKFKDNQLLSLFDNIINSNHGLPLGNFTSR